MNIDVRPMKTAAEGALAVSFASARDRLPGAGTKIAALREEAFGRFENAGLPSRRVEEWKYTDLRILMRDARALAPLPDAAAKLRARETCASLPSIEARRLVFVDGSLVPELSDLDALEPGLSIGSLAASLARADAGVVGRLRLRDRRRPDCANLKLCRPVRCAAGACFATPLARGRIWIVSADCVGALSRSSGDPVL